MDHLSKRIEIAANLAILTVVALLGIVLIKNYLVTGRQERTDPIHNGSSRAQDARIFLPDVDWRGNGQTLVLAVSSVCHFCTESAPFYRQLAKNHGRTLLVAVLPQPVEEGKRYFETLGVAVDEIRQSSLSAIDVSGTPTLMLVNSNGIVVDSWVGKLRTEQETDVLSKAK